VEGNEIVGADGKTSVLTEGDVHNLTFNLNTFESAGTASQLVYINGATSVGLESTHVVFTDNQFVGSASGPLLGLESIGGQVTGNTFGGATSYAQLELWGAGNNVATNAFSDPGTAAYFLDPLGHYDINALIADNSNTFAAGMVTIERGGELV